LYSSIWNSGFEAKYPAQLITGGRVAAGRLMVISIQAVSDVVAQLRT
jgi:hypothetical protein